MISLLLSLIPLIFLTAIIVFWKLKARKQKVPLEVILAEADMPNPFCEALDLKPSEKCNAAATETNDFTRTHTNHFAHFGMLGPGKWLNEGL